MNIIDMARECGAREAVDAEDGAKLIEITLPQITALESRIRADERASFAKLICDTVRPGGQPVVGTGAHRHHYTREGVSR